MQSINLLLFVFARELEKPSFRLMSPELDEIPRTLAHLFLGVAKQLFMFKLAGQKLDKMKYIFQLKFWA